MMNFRILALVLAGGLAFSAPVHAAEGDPARGAQLFKSPAVACARCHVIDKKKNAFGPYLIDVYGRAAGTAEAYKYSKAMRNSGLTWNEETLFGFLEAPRKFLKGTKMPFRGLSKEQDRLDIIAYLKQTAGAE